MNTLTFFAILTVCMFADSMWCNFLKHRQVIAEIEARSRKNKEPIELVEKHDNDSSFS